MDSQISRSTSEDLSAGTADSGPASFREDPGSRAISAGLAQVELRIESPLPGGVALADFDSDGDLDLAYLVQLDGANSQLCWEQNQLAEQTSGGPAEEAAWSAPACQTAPQGSLPMGLAVADLDHDGALDLYMTALGRDQIYWNRPSGFQREPAPEATSRWTVSGSALPPAEWMQAPTLYLAAYLERTAQPVECATATGARDYCGPTNYPAVPDLVLGFGSGAARVAGDPAAPRAAPGLGTALLPLGGAARLYVANDSEENFLLSPQELSGRWPDEAALAGVALNGGGQREASMGIAVGDVDRDGHFDLLVTHLGGETNTLYVQQSNGTFADQTRRWGLGTAGRAYTGFGTGFLDIDLDGWLDLFVANGAVQLQNPASDQLGLAQPNHLYRNLKGERFELLSPAASGFPHVETSRAVALGDVDNDGDIDLAVSNLDGPVRVHRNTARPAASRWLGVDLRLKGGVLTPTLAVIRLESAGDLPQVRRYARDGSYAAASDPRALFVLAENSQDSPASTECVQVTWFSNPTSASSEDELFCGLRPATYHTLEQGQGKQLVQPSLP